jgi:hypothetical protein
MSRNYSDWLSAYIDYAGYGEAPRHMSFWTGVSVIAGALRRRVWIDQVYFKWFPNFYIVLVAPPGIVQKSSTVTIGMSLLRKVPGIVFGPDVVTWQALISAFGDSTSGFDYNELIHVQSPVTLESSEFGNLLNPQDREMVDLLVALWDGKQGNFVKKTKNAGSDEVENPWINLIACTTPSWIAGNFPEYMLGGGFTSRCVFVYAEEKFRLVPYLMDVVPENHADVAEKLLEDLIDISEGPIGPYTITKEAKEWGGDWYRKHYSERSLSLDDERFGGYIARKQTHIHKLAMVLAASEGNDMFITENHLSVANAMVTDLEPDMARVFSKIGKSDYSFYADRLVQFIHKSGTVKYEEAYRFIHVHFPSARDFEDILAGLIRAGFVRMDLINGDQCLVAII